MANKVVNGQIVAMTTAEEEAFRAEQATMVDPRVPDVIDPYVEIEELKKRIAVLEAKKGK